MLDKDAERRKCCFDLIYRSPEGRKGIPSRFFLTSQKGRFKLRSKFPLKISLKGGGELSPAERKMDKFIAAGAC